MQIMGYGGGKGGGGGHTPTEAADNLKSVQYAEVLDLIGEGEMQGLVNGLKSVYLDKVALQNADGTMNFEGVSFASTSGTQGQAALPGFKAVQNEIAVGVAVLVTTPLVRSISTVATDQVRVTISLPQLSQTNITNGDIAGASVEFAIDIQSNGGGYLEKYRTTITGKTMSRYQRSVVLDLPGAAPWNVRVRRITPVAPDVATVNVFYWDSYTEIQQVKLRYPNSVVHGLRVSAQQFNRIPDRAYDMLGLRIQVPSNYNPYTRAYTGVWNGAFTIAWSNNPAWVFYDLCTNPRYGLGGYIDAALIDKWGLYEIAQYCDALVPDGRGGTEPRFACNIVLQTRSEAYKLLQDMAAVFRGMSYWGASAVQFSQDAPSWPEMVFTPSNVIDGIFQYASTSAKQRHSMALVYWNNPEDFFKRVPEVVVDDALVAKYGIRQIEIDPIGITSRGQAYRLGKWALYSEDQETDTLQFKTGLEGGGIGIGKVFKVHDPSEAGERIGGRVQAATATAVTLDDAVTLRAGEAYTLTVMMADATAELGYKTEERSVTTPPGAHNVLTAAPGFSQTPQAQSVWVLASNMVAATLWRCLSVKEVDGEANVYAIEAVAHNPGKFASVEQNIVLEKKPISRLSLAAVAPINLSLSEVLYRERGVYKTRLTIAWQPGALAGAAGRLYNVAWRYNGGAWEARDGVLDQSIDISGLDPGLVDVAVRSVNALGNQSLPLQGSLELLGKFAPPHDMNSLAVVMTDSGARLSWNDPSTIDPDWEAAEISTSASFALASGVVYARTTSHFLGWLSTGTHTYYGRHWDTVKSSVNAAVASITIAAPIAPTIVRADVDANKVNLQWLTAKTTQPLRGYSYTAAKVVADVEQAAIAWGGAGADSLSDVLYFAQEGDYKIYITATDVAGNTGPASIQEVAIKFLQIAYDQLSTSLANQVDLISGIGTGSVNARITAEAADRSNDVAAEAIARADAVLAEANSRTAADSAEATERTTLAASLMSRPNLCPALELWSLPAGFNVVVDSWGKTVRGMGIPAGVYAAYSPKVACFEGYTYTITGDTVLFCSAGSSVYFDLIFFNSANQVVLDGSQSPIYVSHNHSDSNVNRLALQVAAQAPPGAVSVQARFISELSGTAPAVGFRQVKVEQGGLPASLYSEEAALQSTNAAAVLETSARITQDTALAISIATLAAQVTAGDQTNAAAIQNAQIVSVTANAALSTQVTTLQASVMASSPNLCPPIQSWGGTAGFAVFDLGNAHGIFAGFQNAVSDGLQVANSLPMPCYPGSWYCVSADSEHGAVTANEYLYFDLIFYDSSNSVVGDGSQNYILGSHYFDNFGANRLASQAEAQAPATAVTMRARFVAVTKAGKGVYFRRVKVEQKRLPATAYSEEAALQSTNAAAVLETSARITQDTALAISIATLAAQVTAGDQTNAAAIQNAQIVSVTANAALSTQVTTLQASVMASSPNLCPPIQSWGGTAGFAVFDLGNAHGIFAGFQNAVSDGLQVANSLPMPCYPGSWYCVSADSEHGAVTANEYLYFDLIFYDSSNSVVGDGSQNYILGSHYFDNFGANRLASQAEAQAPATAVTMRARFVAVTKAGKGVYFRRVKVEQKRLPATAYSEEAALLQNTASLQIEASTRATQTGELYQQYTVKADVAGLISGYGLASSANNAAPTSAFGVRANSFYIAAPATASATAPTTNLYDGFVWSDTSVTPPVTRYRSGTSWVTTAPVLPFIVQTSPITINGQISPAGVYANDLFVRNGSILNAKIGKLQVDDGHIVNLSVNKLVAGSLQVGAYAQSSNYQAGVSGWRLNGDGTSQLPAANILGKLTANQIEAGVATNLAYSGVRVKNVSYVYGTPQSVLVGTFDPLTIAVSGKLCFYHGYVTISPEDMLPANVAYIEVIVEPTIDGLATYPSVNGAPQGVSIYNRTLHLAPLNSSSIYVPFHYSASPAAGNHSVEMKVTIVLLDANRNYINVNGNYSLFFFCATYFQEFKL